MPGWLTPIVRHFAGGDALFVTAALICLAAFCRLSARGWIQRNASRLAILGLIWFWLSATPLPVWGTAALSLLTVWIALSSSPGSAAKAEAVQFTTQRGRTKRWEAWTWTLLPMIWLGVAGWELTWRLLPEIPYAPESPLIVIGDSISAGLGEGEGTTWPRLLAEQGLTVIDLSHAGDTIQSAIRRIPANLPAEAVILVEIGGNDILGETSVREFEERLDQLLSRVTGTGRTVAMFELPLPPLGNRFGAAQRRLVRKHGVLLIPKRVLLDVLLSPETTQDSLHLNAEGHRQLAESVRRMLKERMTEEDSHFAGRPRYL